MSHWWTAAVGVAGVVGALLIGLGLVIATEVGKKLAVDEVSARLSGLPYASFWIAVRVYPESQRETWFAEWADTYQAIIDDTEGKPLTRLWRTTLVLPQPRGTVRGADSADSPPRAIPPHVGPDR